jgi:hypothetical protein
MRKKGIVSFLLVCAAVMAVGFYHTGADAQYKAAPKKKAAAEKPVTASTCYGCHEPVKQLHAGGKHKGVNCVSCHSGLEKHMKNPGPDTRPVTNTSWEACGQCHKDQYQSFMQVAKHRPARDE